MSTNKLKLNPDKTEFPLIGKERQQSKYLFMFPIELLGVKSYPAKSACNFGVIFDKNFNFRSHISAICNSCIYHIQDLRRIRRHLDLDSAKLLANALVSSRFDYCNSLLSEIAETDLTKRVPTKSPPLTRSVPLLRSLHCVVGCSVNDLDYYYPYQRAYLFGEVGSVPVFESRRRGFDSRPGQFFLYNIGARNG